MIWFEHIKEIFKSRKNLKHVLSSHKLYGPDDYTIDIDGRIFINNIRVQDIIYKGR